MSGLEEGCKKPYSQQVDCIIKLARSVKESTSHQLVDLLVAGTLFLHYRMIS